MGKVSDVRHYTMNINTSSGDFFIPVTDQDIDWEVVFENNLKFTNHVSQCVHKANRILSVIKHSFCNLDPHIFRLFYISLVRPHLDYASPVWNPYSLKDIRILESVQISANAQRRILL